MDRMMPSGTAGISLAMDEGDLAADRPRPVADVPPEALADGVAAAKAWLLALVSAASLDAIASLPTADLAREAPPLCAAVLRATGSDRELARLVPGGDLTGLAAGTGRLAGAHTPAAAAAAVGHLRTALWEVLSPPAGRLDGAHVAALAARLAHVCDIVLQAALSEPGEPAGAAAPVRPAPDPGERAPTELRVASTPAVGEQRDPLDALADVVGVRGTGSAHADEPWTAAVAERIRLHRRDGRPFMVLAVEADEAERLLAADHDGEAARALARAEEAMRREVRADDVVVREHPGRLWLVAPKVDPADARVFGERLAAAVTQSASLHGAPLTISIGVAVCPDDGTAADALVAHADEGVFAARAAGVRLA
jgi:GGDEF domain-containing protein